MQKMYTYDIDLETLLSLLTEARQTGILSAELPHGFMGQKVRCWVRINLANGEILRCQIEDNKGRVQVMGNKKALDLLYGLGPLSWRLDTESPDARALSANKNNREPLELPPSERITNPLLPRVQPSNNLRTPPPLERGNTSPLPPVQSTGSLRMNSASLRLFSAVPQVIANLSPAVLHNLSRRQRRVLVLVDGTRSVEKIAALLFSTPQDTLIVLELLQELEMMGLITLEQR